VEKGKTPQVAGIVLGFRTTSSGHVVASHDWLDGASTSSRATHELRDGNGHRVVGAAHGKDRAPSKVSLTTGKPS